MIVLFPWLPTLLLLLACRVRLGKPSAAGNSFQRYMSRHGLSFDGEEYTMRRNVFLENWARIEELNKQSEAPGVVLGETPFLHMTPEEFVSFVTRGTTTQDSPKHPSSVSIHKPTLVNSLPASVDWSAIGAVTPVKNQGQCGNCWAFSATGALESAYYILHRTFPGNVDPTTGFVGLSEQQVTACDPFSSGCEGGFPYTSFVYAAENGGLTGEEDYPFVAMNFNWTVPTPYSCNRQVDNERSASPNSVNPYTLVKPTLVDFMSATAQQPISIGIAASSFVFQAYTGGIIMNTNNTSLSCGYQVDHAVLLVGYGTLNGVDYWKIKNSWNYTWGLGGYFMVERSKETPCAILNESASYPNLIFAPTLVPTTGPTPIVEIFFDLTFEVKGIIGDEKPVKLSDSGANAAAVDIKSVVFGGLAVGPKKLHATACKNRYYQANSQLAQWIVGAVYEGSAYVASVTVINNQSLHHSCSVLMEDPFVVVGYNLSLSCNTLTAYWLGQESEGLSVIESLPVAKSIDGDGLVIIELKYVQDYSYIVANGFTNTTNVIALILFIIAFCVGFMWFSLYKSTIRPVSNGLKYQLVVPSEIEMDLVEVGSSAYNNELGSRGQVSHQQDQQQEQEQDLRDTLTSCTYGSISTFNNI